MEPLSTLSPSKQNARLNRYEVVSPQKQEYSYQSSPGKISVMAAAPISPPDSPNAEGVQDLSQQTPPSSPRPVSSHSQSFSPLKARSPIKYRFQDDGLNKPSPPGSSADSTIRFNEGLTRAIGNLQNEIIPDHPAFRDATMNIDEGMSTIYHSPSKTDAGDDFDITLSMDETVNMDNTVGDLSTISAIHTDMTRFANLRASPQKGTQPDAWSPSKQLRESTTFETPAAHRPRPLLLGRQSSGSEDNDATPRRPRTSNESAEDLMNFTGLTNIHIPPPDSAPRTQRRSPSGRGAFPIRVNPTPTHRSQASVDRERAGGRSVHNPLPDRSVPSTPAPRSSVRHSIHSFNGFGMDLLDIDLEPMATPRSIPTVTPRELETLRSELQSRISGLEATLSGKEAEVLALKRAITDAEVRAGKACEELRTERTDKEELQAQNGDLERRSREMEEVLRELKQNAFMEEREREKLRRQAEDAERKAEDHEIKILELNASLETLSSDRLKASLSPHKFSEPATPGVLGASDIDAAVKNATETVARELHALYKTKHERKVSDLKISYEKRWIKQVEQLRGELKESQGQILKLEAEREATMSGVLPNQLQNQTDQISRMEGQIEELRRFNDETVADKKVLQAEVSGLKQQLDSVISDNKNLRNEVESERTEKGELVTQVEIFLTESTEQERELERLRTKDAERERDIQREKEALQREREAQRVTPTSPPRSDCDASSTTTNSAYVSGSVLSPNKFRNSFQGGYANGPVMAHNASGRARPMSMLQKPAANKFSGIPAPGLSGLKAPKSASGYSSASRGTLMDGIARMGAGGR